MFLILILIIGCSKDTNLNISGTSYNSLEPTLRSDINETNKNTNEVINKAETNKKDIPNIIDTIKKVNNEEGEIIYYIKKLKNINNLEFSFLYKDLSLNFKKLLFLETILSILNLKIQNIDFNKIQDFNSNIDFEVYPWNRYSDLIKIIEDDNSNNLKNLLNNKIGNEEPLIKYIIDNDFLTDLLLKSIDLNINFNNINLLGYIIKNKPSILKKLNDKNLLANFKSIEDIENNFIIAIENRDIESLEILLSAFSCKNRSNIIDLANVLKYQDVLTLIYRDTFSKKEIYKEIYKKVSLDRLFLLKDDLFLVKKNLENIEIRKVDFLKRRKIEKLKAKFLEFASLDAEIEVLINKIEEIRFNIIKILYEIERKNLYNDPCSNNNLTNDFESKNIELEEMIKDLVNLLSKYQKIIQNIFTKLDKYF